MKNKLSADSIEIHKKKEILEAATEKLKADFIGLDKIIEEIINSITPWYLYGFLLDKPVVINLWGHTGTGKTSLVHKLSHYLEISPYFFQFNFDNTDNKLDFCTELSVLENLDVDVNGKAFFFFDNFQNLKTFDNNGNEKIETTKDFLWEFINSGKFIIDNYSPARSFHVIKMLINKIEKFMNAGMKISNGEVLTMKQEYKSTPPNPEPYYKGIRFIIKGVPVIEQRYYEYLYHYGDIRYKSDYDLEKKLSTLNGIETIEFLKETLKRIKTPRLFNFSKSVIVISNTVDESFPAVKQKKDVDFDKYLHKQFTHEKIARLGNNHIIFPSLDKNAPKKIIELYLKNYSTKFLEENGIVLEFTGSFQDFILKKSVELKQEARHIQSTIQHIVLTNLGETLWERFRKDIDVDRINYSFNNSNIVIKYYNKNELIVKSNVEQPKY